MPTPQTTVYDFDRVICTVGPIMIDGYMEGTSISVEQEEGTFSHYVGDDGKVARSKTLNRVAKVTLTLMQTSAANDKLATLHELDRDAPNGAGIVPFALIDLSGRTVVTGTESWVSKAADVMFDRVCVARTWEITISRAEPFQGGN